MTSSRFYPGILQAIELIVIAILLSGFIVFGLSLFAPALAKHPAALGLSNLVSIAAVLAWGARKTGAPVREVFRLKPISPTLLLPMTLTLIGASVLISETDNLFRTLLPIPQGLADFFLDVLSGRVSLWGSLFVAVVVAPLTEELLFRGLILHGFLGNYGISKAVLASALLFASFHLNPWQFFGAFVAGILFAWWFVQTGSLLPCLFGHALGNSLPTIAQMTGLKISGYTGEFAPEPVLQPLWFDLAGLALTAAGLLLLLRAFRKVGYTPPAGGPSQQPPDEIPMNATS